MSIKEDYREFCENEKSIPIFLTYKWLENIAPNWNVVLYKKNNQIVGAYPYILYNKFGFTIIDLTPLTSYGGIWIKYPDRTLKNVDKLSYEKEVINQIIQQLPFVDYINQKFHSDIQNWLPFYWSGFTQTTRYTYILKNLKDTSTIYQNIDSKTRNIIRKAEKNIKIESSDDIEILCKLRTIALQKKGLATEHEIKKVFEFCKKENCGELLIGKSDNEIHCAALFVWDATTCYYLYGVSNPQFKSNGGISLLLWEAIQRYSTKVEQFNFEGSMVESIEKFFRSFGGTQTPYFHIQKTNSNLLKIKNFIQQF